MAFGIWTFVLGLLLGNTALILSIVPVGLYLALSLLVSRPHLGVTVNRVLPEGQIYEGEEVRVSLAVTNKGTSVDLELVDLLPQGVEVTKGTNHVFAALNEGDRRSFFYSFTPRLFGAYTLGPIRIRTTDRSSARYEETMMGSFGSLRVYPEVKYLNRVELRHPHPRNWPGETVTRRPRQGLEFYGIKEHSPDEPFRRINWKATSRSGRLMVNQYMDEAGGEILVVLDSRSISRVGVHPDTTEAYSVRAAAALSYRLLRDKNRVGLLGVGRHLIKVPVGSGRRHFEKMMIGLVSTETTTTDEWGLDIAPYYISLFFSRMVQIILVSPVVDGMPIAFVSDLAHRGYNVLVLSPSPVQLDVVNGGDAHTVSLARELATIDRNQRLSTMRSHAHVIDWDPSTSLKDALEGLRVSWRLRRLA
jgi:uncharacterized protein (DUF58 family)